MINTPLKEENIFKQILKTTNILFGFCVYIRSPFDIRCSWVLLFPNGRLLTENLFSILYKFFCIKNQLQFMSRHDFIPSCEIWRRSIH